MLNLRRQGYNVTSNNGIRVTINSGLQICIWSGRIWKLPFKNNRYCSTRIQRNYSKIKYFIHAKNSFQTESKFVGLNGENCLNLTMYPSIRTACKVHLEPCWSNKVQNNGRGMYRMRMRRTYLISRTSVAYGKKRLDCF